MPHTQSQSLTQGWGFLYGKTVLSINRVQGKLFKNVFSQKNFIRTIKASSQVGRMSRDPFVFSRKAACPARTLRCLGLTCGTEARLKDSSHAWPEHLRQGRVSLLWHGSHLVQDYLTHVLAYPDKDGYESDTSGACVVSARACDLETEAGVRLRQARASPVASSVPDKPSLFAGRLNYFYFYIVPRR